MRITDDNVNTVSAVIYTTGASLAAVVIFGLATAADYDWVSRIGGAGWVFLLTMIILMPIVPSLLRERAGKEAPEASVSDESVPAELVKDPVCGMEIDPASAAGSSEYEGQTHHFCNLNCKESFDAEPEKYATN
jgi:YHS domain-containing protein